MPNDTRRYTWNHEVGHRFGMTADGLRNSPDKPATFYSDRIDNKNYGGHRGPHCNIGTVYDEVKDTWSGVPGCVMFGANGIANNHSPEDYCEPCKKIIKKVDLSA